MIQVGTHLNIVDNSGARKVACIKLLRGFKRRYACIGDLILVSIKSIRSKRKLSSKTKKGEKYRALIVKTKSRNKSIFGDSISFNENSAVLLNTQNKLIGTRIFGSIPRNFRYTKFLRVATLSSGLVY